MPGGRPPKPGILKLVEGNKGKRKIRLGPQYDKGFGSCPKRLIGEARKLWRSLAPQLESKGLSAKVFRPALEGLCVNYARALEAEEILREKGFSIEIDRVDKSGNPIGTYLQQRPEVAIAQKSWHLVKLFLVEFGLTPSSIGKVDAKNEEEKSLEELLA
jgi:P27 family predicted phage terminase small subunit